MEILQDNIRLREINSELILRNNVLVTKIDKSSINFDEIFENEKMSLLVFLI